MGRGVRASQEYPTHRRNAMNGAPRFVVGETWVVRVNLCRFHGPKTAKMTDCTVLHVWKPRAFVRRKLGDVWVALGFVWILRLRSE